MDWSYFRKEPDGFSLKRLPTISKPVRIKDETELSDYRQDFKGLSFDSGLDQYQSLFDSHYSYEVEVEPFDEAANRAPAALLLDMAPFKGHMDDVEWLLENSEPIDLELSPAALKRAQASELIVGDESGGYLAGPRLAGEFMGLIERMVGGVREAVGDMPKSYQEAVWSEMVIWDGLPPALAHKAIGAYGGPNAEHIAKDAQERAASRQSGEEYGPPHFTPPTELHFRYQGSKDSYPKQRRVAVHHIVGVHQLYLKGRCLDSNEERSFLGHRIEGDILNTQTGELIKVEPDTTSQQLRVALKAKRTTDKPSGVATAVDRVAATERVEEAAPASTQVSGEKQGAPWYRRPAVWLWVAVILMGLMALR